jgi:hypothetical protein
MNALVRGVFYRVINMPPAQSLLHGEGIPIATIGLLNPLLLVGRKRTSFFGIVRQ